MNRIIGFICIAFVVLFLVSCGGKIIKALSSSSDYIGENYEKVVSEFQEAGFSDIEVMAVEDITSENIEQDCCVQSVMIGETEEFSTDDKFDSTSKVKINYHYIPRITPPIEKNEYTDMEYSEVAKAFTDAGFTNVVTEQVYDLDPDTESRDFITEVLINGSSDFTKSDEVLFDQEIKVLGHYKYAKYDGTILVDFSPNLFLDIYDVNVYIDDELIDTLSHGKDAEIEIRLKEGEHTITFANINNSEVKGSVDFMVASKFEASVYIKGHDDNVEVKENYVINFDALAENEAVIMCDEFAFYHQNYKDVIQELKDLGFTNINKRPDYCIKGDELEPGSVTTVTIDGTIVYKRGDIFDKNVEVIIIYSMRVEDDPNYVPEEEKKEEKTESDEDEKNLDSEEESSEPESNGLIEDNGIALPAPDTELGKDFSEKESSYVFYWNGDNVNPASTEKWEDTVITDRVAEYLNNLVAQGYTVTITGSNNSSLPGGIEYDTYFEVSKSDITWTMDLVVQDDEYVEYSLQIYYP